MIYEWPCYSRGDYYNDGLASALPCFPVEFGRIQSQEFNLCLWTVMSGVKWHVCFMMIKINGDYYSGN